MKVGQLGKTREDVIILSSGCFLSSSSDLSAPSLPLLPLPFSNEYLLIQYDKEALKETNTSDNEIAESIFIIPQVKWQIENF